MASMNISIRQDVYNLLTSLKKGNQSFSEVILELSESKVGKNNKEDVLKFWGVLKEKKKGEREKRLMISRESIEHELEYRSKK